MSSTQKNKTSSHDQSRPVDEDTLGKRLKRYAQTSSGVGGMLLKLASERYLGQDIDRKQHAQKLKEALGALRGPIVKVAQLLATIPDIIPDEYAFELQQLQSNAPSMGWPFVRRRMAGELGNDWQDKFEHFERSATAAASLGQVHKARSLNGEELACKIQYPDMESAVKADLQQLKLVMKIFDTVDRTFGTQHAIKELEERLWEELDYELEAKYQQLYGAIFKDNAHVHVPQVYPELSTKRLLTSQWLHGCPILDFKDADQSVKKVVAKSLFQAWYIPFYHYGVIHGDPHLGNYFIQDDYSVNLLDFGCIRVFPTQFVTGVINLYRALQTDNRDMAVQAFEQWGFEGLSNEVIDILMVWARFLYDPILDNTTRVIGKGDKGVYGREIAQKVHIDLRKAGGGIVIPKEFVFMDRAALGLGSVFIHLQAELNWYELFQGLIEGFDAEKLAKQQQKILSDTGVSANL